MSTILSVPPGFHAAYGLTARVPDLLRHQIAYWHPFPRALLLLPHSRLKVFIQQCTVKR